ncbi:MBL fold metallo-hydrolase [Candidatus Bathyarchaeota archaeon]|nr:MBL fold metallo-hydrolase [Candidatus Bathyarchaeota archaeon]
MEFQRVNSRGYLFSFTEPYFTNIYVINGDKHIIFLDTYLGPDVVKETKKKLFEEGISDKPFIVFNSHADYDHYWGNQEFSDSWIIAHDSSYKRIQTQGKESLTRYEKMQRGEVKITLPNLLFRKKLTLPEDKIEFFHSPGHTGDSASCWDQVDRVLFVGDNLESPFPQINLLNLKEWQTSLEEYTKIDPKTIITGHTVIQNNKNLLTNNYDYIKNIQSLKINYTNFSENEKLVHFRNVRRIGGLYQEKGDKNKAKEYFNEALKIINDTENVPDNIERRNRLIELIKKID